MYGGRKSRGNITLYNLHSSCLFSDYVCPHHWIVIVWHLFQETGWVPQHIVAQDDSDNVLGVIPLYLKRLVYFYLYFIHCEKENYSYTHVTHTAKGCLSNCLLSYMFCAWVWFYPMLQPFLWWICLRPFMGRCLLQLWIKILSEIAMLCAFHSSHWPKDISSWHKLQGSGLWYFSLCIGGADN